MAPGGLLGMAVKVPARKPTQSMVLAVGWSGKMERISPVLSNLHGSRAFLTINQRYVQKQGWTPV